ncbi:MAG: cytochrome C biogenesis protein CcmB [Sulfobacillus thermosulfidooxidans]|uniref:heme exporter protein CcmB n=1 Tax=Sulfobacillus TaxID=28033 RepID=UPI000CD2C6C1|nr:heme exporter protein CcmB [Sulfobacillus sp. hq2]POB10687.1 cytochrome C biogenesis protein CcmB [Sulfobacillus sp. hq2]PSR36494.1 MAG: cytochrome C biogenesis protein CcmB [Sulfobacillus thermosulfidooxidans]
MLYKDGAVELRRRDRWTVMMIFVVMMAFLFALSLGSHVADLHAALPGILWMAFLFAGMIGMGKTFANEVREEALTGLILAPGDKIAIYLAKLTGAFVFMVLIEIVSTPLFLEVFQVPWRGPWTLWLLILALGAAGFVEVGTLLSTMSVHTSSGDLILTMLLLPLEIPVMIMTVQATRDLLTLTRAGFWLWIHGLIAYDAIFLVLPLMLYDYVWEV